MNKKTIRIFHLSDRITPFQPRHCDLKENLRCIENHLKMDSQLYIIKIL